MDALQDDGRGARRWSAHMGEAIICSVFMSVKLVTHGRGHTHGRRRDGCYHRAMDSQQSGDRMPTVDLAPLVSHIATLEDQVQRLTDSNTMWQIRARQAEEQLKQLTTGNVAPENALEPNTVDAEAPQLPQESDPTPTGALGWWKRLWGG